MKKLLKSYLGELTWARLAQAKIEFNLRNKKIHMDLALSLSLSDLLNSKTGYYVDVGAHDGRSFSNTYHLEHRGWQGILIEPVPMTYFKLKEIRDAQKNIFVNAACVASSYSSDKVEILYGDLMSIAPAISDIDPEHWLEGARKYMQRNEEQIKFWVPAKTLTDILKSSNAPRQIDFLSIDVEGSENEVLRGCDLSIYRFKTICIESFNPKKIIRYLENYNYDLQGTIENNLIFRYR